MKSLPLVLCCLFLGGCGSDEALVESEIALHDLAEQGQTGPLMATIAREGGQVDRRDVCYRTPLMLAAQFGRLETVQALLEAGAGVDLHEKGRYTALMLAAGNGHADVVQILLDAGANVNNIEQTRGWTALIWAAKRGHTDTVRVLLEHGAETAIGDDQGRTARAWAETQRHHEIVVLIDDDMARG